MTELAKILPKWILVVSGIFALLEILVSLQLCFAKESALETIDLNAKGVDFLIYMWASRQFALGVILAFATYKRSVPMLTLAYIFLLVMFAADFIIGLLQKENAMVIGAIVMFLISSGLIMAVQREK